MVHTAGAQTGGEAPGPQGGSWGAEVSYGGFNGVSLLRFSSPRAAWLLGADFAIGQETSDVYGFPGVTRTTNRLGTVGLRAGRRWWSGEANARLRPLMGLGLTGRYASYPNIRTRDGSAYGEYGATYFFSPHVSLGAAGELAVARGQDRYTSTGNPDAVTDRWYLRGNLVRFNASVYFQ